MSADSAHSTALLGRRLVVEALEARGWSVRETRVGRRPVMMISRHGLNRQVRVSARRRGTWQSSTADGARLASDEQRGRFWIFVDVGSAEPSYFVVPEDWMAEDIYTRHQSYLDRSGGHRKRTAGSHHHAIEEDRIERWRERWDLLEEPRR